MCAENVLFILTDQWPASAFSFCGAEIPTPNIDRLAAEGTVFSNAFTTCPLCTPARGTLLTGGGRTTRGSLTTTRWDIRNSLRRR